MSRQEAGQLLYFQSCSEKSEDGRQRALQRLPCGTGLSNKPMMLASSVQQCLGLCVFFMMASRIHGKVASHPHLQVLVGSPVTLRCNLSLLTGEVLKQVRWLDSRNVTVLTYLPRHTPSVSDPEHVVLASATRDSSAVTITRVGPRDEGCYKCLFDVYPSGTQEGHTCLTLTAKVSSEGNRTALSGKQAVLSCRYGLLRRVQQVLWTKAVEQAEYIDVASFARRGEPIILESLLGRVSLSRTLDESHLYIWHVRTEDEGCYTCEFHAYPEGVKNTVVCLTVYGKL